MRPGLHSLPGNLHVDRVTEEPAETFLHTFAASRFCHEPCFLPRPPKANFNLINSQSDRHGDNL
jgi:hypothetical protein